MAAGTAETDVANKALIEMGERTLLTSLTDDRESARVLNQIWNISRRAVLRAHFWNFALKRKQLAADPTAPVFGSESNRYRLPSDYINLIRLYPEEYTWRLESDYLLSDYGAPLDVVYVRDEDNLGVWDALALDAFATRLASDAAYAITGNREVRAELTRAYQAKLAEARHMDAMEGQSTRELDIDVWGQSRGSWAL